jgi:hypothetical protein
MFQRRRRSKKRLNDKRGHPTIGWTRASTGAGFGSELDQPIHFVSETFNPQ